MPRTVVGYIKQYLNNMASASPTGSTEPVTGLPIATGLNPGQFTELTDADAKLYSYTAWGTLYSGTYMWVKLDPAVTTDPIAMGSAVYWLQTDDTATGDYTVTTTNSGNNPDLAGWTIDSNFGASHPYAFIQTDGKVNALFDGTPATAFGDVIGLTGTTAGTVTRQGAATQAATGLTIGISLVATGTASARNLIRVTRGTKRF